MILCLVFRHHLPTLPHLPVICSMLLIVRCFVSSGAVWPNLTIFLLHNSLSSLIDSRASLAVLPQLQLPPPHSPILVQKITQSFVHPCCRFPNFSPLPTPLPLSPPPLPLVNPNHPPPLPQITHHQSSTSLSHPRGESGANFAATTTSLPNSPQILLVYAPKISICFSVKLGPINNNLTTRPAILMIKDIINIYYPFNASNSSPPSHPSSHPPSPKISWSHHLNAPTPIILQ